MERYSQATPSTPLLIQSGAVADINDNNTSTTCEVIGTSAVYFWFTMDLGASLPVIEVDINQWYEIGGADVGFSIQYSDSPLNSGNIGTSYGTTFSAVTYPTKQDTIRNPSIITARYWGLDRQGNFTGQNVGVADFNLFAQSSGMEVISMKVNPRNVMNFWEKRRNVHGY